MQKTKLALLSALTLAWTSNIVAQPMPPVAPTTPPPVATPPATPPSVPTPPATPTPTPPPAATDAQTVTSTDGKIQLTLPGGWSKESDLNKTANIQYSNRNTAQFVVTMTEAKSSFPAGFDINKHSEVTRQNIVKGLTGAQQSGPTQLTIGGNPAVQYVIKGKLAPANNIDISYVHTTIETGKNFHQVVFWTADSLFAQSQPVFQSVLNSFKEVQP